MISLRILEFSVESISTRPNAGFAAGSSGWWSVSARRARTANAGISDIRVELRTMQGDINNHSARLARVEAIVENNTHRLEMLEKQ